jgi:hypothetical protein
MLTPKSYSGANWYQNNNRTASSLPSYPERPFFAQGFLTTHIETMKYLIFMEKLIDTPADQFVFIELRRAQNSLITNKTVAKQRNQDAYRPLLNYRIAVTVA